MINFLKRLTSRGTVRGEHVPARDQLAFDFGAGTATVHAPGGLIAPAADFAATILPAALNAEDAEERRGAEVFVVESVIESSGELGADNSDERAAPRPARGRAAMRARTAGFFSRLEALGLRGVDGLVLMRTRSVMVSLIGRTLRVHEGYADADETVLRAIVTFATARNRAVRNQARDVILAYDVERAPVKRREERARPGDVALIAQLTVAHQELNDKWFAGALAAIPVRLSGRMATRLGHFDPGSKFTPPEIVMSRRHVVRHGWREAMHTLLHEMVHQWQHETGQPVDHGAEFRRKCREVGITPAARRDVTPLVKRSRRAKQA